MNKTDADCPQVTSVGRNPAHALSKAGRETRDVSPRISLRVIRDFGEWLEMRDLWEELLRHSVYPNVFATWEWQTTWWKWFGKARKLNILLVEDGRQTLGIAPLYAERDARLSHPSRPTLRFIGNGGAVCPEYLGLIVRHGFVEDVCAIISGHLLHENSEWDNFRLEEYALDDLGTVRLAKMLCEDATCISRNTEPRVFISLPKTYNEYLASLSGHSRQKKRNRLRQAYSRHNATFIHLAADNIECWLPTIAVLSAKARERQGKKSPFSNNNYAGFHRDLLSAIMPLGYARVCLLMLDNEPAAFWYLLCYKSTFYAYQTGADVSRPGSPGDVALQMAVMLAIDERGTEFDFLRGDHSYKQSYGNSQRATQTLVAYRRPGWTYIRHLLIDRVLRPAKTSFAFLLIRRERD